jgi:predicted ABC-type sugar transport system permease subunit
VAITRQDTDPLAKAARAGLLVVIALVAFASLAPVSWIPQLLYSYHLEHFAAFFAVSASMAAARYRIKLRRIALNAFILATLLEGIRAFTPAHRLSAGEDWISDVGGILVALSAVWIGTFRRSFADLNEG